MKRYELCDNLWGKYTIQKMWNDSENTLKQAFGSEDNFCISGYTEYGRASMKLTRKGNNFIFEISCQPHSFSEIATPLRLCNKEKLTNKIILEIFKETDISQIKEKNPETKFTNTEFYYEEWGDVSIIEEETNIKTFQDLLTKIKEKEDKVALLVEEFEEEIYEKNIRKNQRTIKMEQLTIVFVSGWLIGFATALILVKKGVITH